MKNLLPSIPLFQFPLGCRRSHGFVPKLFFSSLEYGRSCCSMLPSNTLSNLAFQDKASSLGENCSPFFFAWSFIQVLKHFDSCSGSLFLFFSLLVLLFGFLLLLEQGWKRGHGKFYLYSFDIGKFVGTDPWDFPCHEIAIYYSYNTAISDKFRIITAYPLSQFYHNYFMSR